MVNFFFFYFFFKKYIYYFLLDLKSERFYIYIKKEYLLDLFFFFKKSLFFKNNLLIDLTSCDFLIENKRFLMVYNFLNVFYNFRIFFLFYFIDLLTIKNIKLIKNFIYSISNLYYNANWSEREIWDMFGIFFLNHTDLRRILTDYGFMGFPLRKDYPLTGFFEIRYDDNLKIIVNEHIKLIQEFRLFNFINPWEYE